MSDVLVSQVTSLVFIVFLAWSSSTAVGLFTYKLRTCYSQSPYFMQCADVVRFSFLLCGLRFVWCNLVFRVSEKAFRGDRKVNGRVYLKLP